MRCMNPACRWCAVISSSAFRCQVSRVRKTGPVPAAGAVHASLRRKHLPHRYQQQAHIFKKFVATYLPMLRASATPNTNIRVVFMGNQVRGCSCMPGDSRCIECPFGGSFAANGIGDLAGTSGRLAVFGGGSGLGVGLHRPALSGPRFL